MSYSNKLLQGVDVEWTTLGDTCEIKTGKGITKSDSTVTALYPIISGGKEPMGYFHKFNRVENTVTISRVGANAGYVSFLDRKFYLNDKCFSILPTEKYKYKIDSKFLFYVLKTKETSITELQSEGGVPTINTTKVASLFIPIPPLTVQKEIVGILDKMTELTEELTEELTAELTARKQQYNYYREQLLSFEEGEVEWKSLAEVAENLDSMRKPVTSGFREAGNIPYYGASGIVDYVKDYIFDGDFLLVSEDGANLIARNTPIAFSIAGKSWVNNHAHVLKFNTYAERRFVEYYLNSIDLTPFISGAAQPKLNQKNLNSIKVPVPSPKEQERIVSILDKFDVLTTSISEGLPKEIELRKKQYEYYRDLLLTFPKHNIQS